MIWMIVFFVVSLYAFFSSHYLYKKQGGKFRLKYNVFFHNQFGLRMIYILPILGIVFSLCGVSHFSNLTFLAMFFGVPVLLFLLRVYEANR